MVAGIGRSSFFGPPPLPSGRYYLPWSVVVATTTFLGGTQPTIQFSAGLAVDASSTHSRFDTFTLDAESLKDSNTTKGFLSCLLSDYSIWELQATLLPRIVFTCVQ